jgi:predicted DNA binding protein
MDPSSSASQVKGRLSNPVQRRLTDSDIDALVGAYQAGSTIEMLANTFGVHRTTAIAHLERRGISRRSPRKLTDEMVTGAEQRYTGGETLAEIAASLGIAPSTLTRELQLAGVTIRRRGRPPSG